MPVIVELGCGPRKRPGRIGVDQVKLPCVDIVADINKGLPFFSDNSVDEIHTNSLVAHLDDLSAFLQELTRVLKKDGKVFLFTPHFSNPYFYSDYTHKRFFGLYNFYYFVDQDKQLKRKVPTFYGNTRIEIESIKLVFTSPFRILNYGKKIFQAIINSHSAIQEFYEENLSRIIPCYGMEIIFRPDK